MLSGSANTSEAQRRTKANQTTTCASLNLRKTNTGNRRNHQIALSTGLFLPEQGVSSLGKLAHEQKADETFLTLLARFECEGRNVSDKKNAPNFAPAEFAQEIDPKESNLRKPDLEAAMRRLFVSGKIRVETYGRPSRQYTKLVTAVESDRR